MRIRGRKAPPCGSPCPDSHGAAAAQAAWERGGGSGDDVADAEATTVRRSSMAPCNTCVLCGGFLRDRDATTMPECLHAFCRECIFEHFTHVNINSCPKCNTDLGFNPLNKRRANHSLQHIISPKHPAFVPLPSPSRQGHAVDHSAKKTDAYLMGEPRNTETDTKSGDWLEREPFMPLAKPMASILCTAGAAGAGPSWPALAANSGNQQQGDAHWEHTPMSLRKGEQCVKELQGMVGDTVEFEESKVEHHGLTDKEVTTQERNAHADEAVAVVEERKARVCAESTLSLAAEFSVGGSAALSPVTSQIKAHKIPYHCSVTATEEQRLKSPPDALNELNVIRSLPLLQYSRRKNKRPRGVDDEKADAGSRNSSSKQTEAECHPKKLCASKAHIENTARLVERVETCIGRTHALEPEKGSKEKFDIEREERAIVLERTRITEERSARILEMMDAYICRDQALEAEVAILRGELENERAEKASALERARVLNGKLQIQSVRAHRKSELVHQADAAWRKLFQNYQAKSEEHVTLQHNFDMVKEEKIALENQVDHLMRTLAEEKQHNSEVIAELRSKSVKKRSA